MDSDGVEIALHETPWQSHAGDNLCPHHSPTAVPYRVQVFRQSYPRPVHLTAVKLDVRLTPLKGPEACHG